MLIRWLFGKAKKLPRPQRRLCIERLEQREVPASLLFIAPAAAQMGGLAPAWTDKNSWIDIVQKVNDSPKAVDPLLVEPGRTVTVGANTFTGTNVRWSLT